MGRYIKDKEDTMRPNNHASYFFAHARGIGVGVGVGVGVDSCDTSPI